MIDYLVISLGELLLNYNAAEINESFKQFNCERERDLQKFLQEKSITYENAGTGRTYLFLDKDEFQKMNFKIMGFFTISQTSVDISAMSQKKKKKVLGSAVPGRDSLNSFSAFLIGQLGRNDSYNSIQLPGHYLLHECYLQLKEANKLVGGEHVILECRECMFMKFYNNQGFKLIADDTNKDGLYTLYNRVKFKDLPDAV